MSALRGWIPLVSVSFVLVPGVSPAEVPLAATRAMLEQRPGAQAANEGGPPVAIYGVPLARDADPATTTEAFVESFLTEHAAALGLEDVTLELANTVHIREDKFSVYTYTQELDGLPVHGGVVKLLVLLGETEKIAYIGIRITPPPGGDDHKRTIAIRRPVARISIPRTTSGASCHCRASPEKTQPGFSP